MTPERWQKVKQIFQSAIERPPDERDAFVARACQDNPALRSEVESLISSHDQAGDSIEAMAAEAATEMLADDRTIVGQQIGRYQVLSRIGRGGMGEVFLAQDTSLGRKVALKLLRSDFTRNEERLRRFRQEARAASALNHPNILTIHEIGQEGSLHFMATEYVKGETLREHISRARMALGEALDVAVQAASALAAAHNAGIIHRDIKPENVMLRTDGYVKVLDFGLAKLAAPKAIDTVEPTLAKVETEPGLVMGTVQYMSPEQARGLEVDARTDIFSLGVVLYEMVAGRAPFEGGTTSDVLATILKTEPRPLSSKSAEAPTELEQIVTKALRKDAAERYQVVGDMLSDLRGLRQELEFQSRLGRVAASGASTRAMVRSRGDGEEAATTKQIVARPISSIEYFVSEVRRHKAGALAALSLIGVGVIVLASYLYLARGDSLAVLPFTYVNTDPSTNADPDREFFADGITEDLINRLSRLPRLRLIARNSVFRYKGKEADPQAVGRELGVRTVLMGRIVQRGDDLNISVELVDARNNSHLWGEQYDRKVADIFAVQKEIARDISDKLGVRLTGEELGRANKDYTENAEAYQLYLKGRYFWNKRTPEDLQRAADYFQQAIAKDPSYALAYTGLADAYFYMGYAFGRTPPREAMPKAKAAALKALELDESLAEAHTSLGLVKFVYDWDWAGAEDEFKRAIQLNPNYPSAYHFYSAYLICVHKRFDEAIAVAKRGIELDPLSIPINNILANHLHAAGRYDEAIEQRRKVLELNPNDADQHAQLSGSYAAKGMYDEAFAERLHADTLSGVDKEKIEEYRRIYASSGWSAYLQKKTRDEQERILRKLNQENHTNLDAWVAVGSYAALGEKDKAFELLDRMYEDRNGMLIWLKVDRHNPLRSDPRFEELVRRVGLPK
ncbi:MAG: protein kinase domain-containing protein [Pyrinomonadaceae bacterium]